MKTGWYDGSVKPARYGWYEVRCKYNFYDKEQRLYWNGKKWLFNPGNPRATPASFGNFCDQWRGLTERAANGD